VGSVWICAARCIPGRLPLCSALHTSDAQRAKSLAAHAMGRFTSLAEILR
jgi:hypothetical protein